MQVDTIGSKIKGIKGQDSLQKALKRLRKRGRRIVFTNGCFDLLHPGHISYLRRSKKCGDLLVVGLNSDSSVRTLKGKGRPITHQRKRAELLSSLEFVDFVTVFNERTPIKLIKKIKPDVLIKGADWRKDDIVGRDFVESYGGKVKRIPYLKGYSTTALIRSICKKFCR